MPIVSGIHIGALPVMASKRRIAVGKKAITATTPAAILHNVPLVKLSKKLISYPLYTNSFHSRPL